MPYEIRNKLRGPSFIRCAGAATYGPFALSEFSANTGQETVTNLVITKIKYSLLPSTGVLSITRNSVPLLTLYGNGEWIHDDMGLANTSGGTLTITIGGGGSCILTASKVATYNVDTEKL